MNSGDAYDRVKAFLELEKLTELSPEAVETRVKNIEKDIYALFNMLEKLHAAHPELKEIDLSEDIYSLVRMLQHEKVKKQYPLLARAAALF